MRMSRNESFPLFSFSIVQFMDGLCVLRCFKNFSSSQSPWGHTEYTSSTYCECLTSWPVFLRSETQRGRVGGAIKIFCACVLRVLRILPNRAARWTYRGGPMTAKRHARESSAQEVRHGQYLRHKLGLCSADSIAVCSKCSIYMLLRKGDSGDLIAIPSLWW